MSQARSGKTTGTPALRGTATLSGAPSHTFPVGTCGRARRTSNVALTAQAKGGKGKLAMEVRIKYFKSCHYRPYFILPLERRGQTQLFLEGFPYW